jgi:iron complex transport system permease protein
MPDKGRGLSVILVCLAVLLAAALVSLGAGSYGSSVPDIVRALFGASSDKRLATVLFNVRLPRVLTSIVGGVALGISGCVLQAVLRNPMAASSTLGISQGAAFGAAFAIIVLGAGKQMSGGALLFNNAALISLCAFAFSLSVSAVILAMSRFIGASPEALVLAGVALSSLFSGATTILQYFASDVDLTFVVFWTFGDLGRAHYHEIAIMAAVTGVLSVFFWLNRWNYNALEIGEESAVSLGINVPRMRLLNMAAASLVAAIVVSFAGIINFIGLIAPHIVRRWTGGNHAFLLPASAIMGAVLLLTGDLVSRTVISPVLLPIGAITSFLGAPLFLYLLFKRGRRI